MEQKGSTFVGIVGDKCVQGTFAYQALKVSFKHIRTCIRQAVYMYVHDVWVGVNQAYSRLSTTHGHITDWKLDSVVYAGVCVVIFLMWTCLVWAERSLKYRP